MSPRQRDAPAVTKVAPGVEIDYCPSCRGVWLDRPDDRGQPYRKKRKESWLSEIFD